MGLKPVNDLPTHGETDFWDLGWKDIIGDVTPKQFGVGSPPFVSWKDDIRWYNYGVGDDGDVVYHIPHDYAPGTNLFLHLHWGHNGTNIANGMDIRYHLSYAKGHSGGAFSADVEPHLVLTGLSLVNTPQYMHRIDEIQISRPGGGGLFLDTNLIEPDGLLLLHYDLDAIPTITGGSGKPFIFCLDVHYQTDRHCTPNKVPNFWRA